MQSRKLARILTCFSKKQWDGFTHFLKLPYLKVHKKHHEIYAYIKTRYRRQQKKNAEPETFFPSIDRLNHKFFPKDSNFKRLTTHLYVLHQHVRSFLAMERTRENTLLLDLTSIDIAIQAEEYSYAETAMDRVWKEIGQEADDWYTRYQFSLLRDRLYSETQHPNRGITMTQIEASLDDFYLIAKLKNYCMQLNEQQAVNNFKINNNQKIFEDYLNNYVKQRDYLPIILRAYYQVLQVLQQRNAPESIKNLGKLLKENTDSFTKKERENIQVYIRSNSTYLLNYQKAKPLNVLRVYQASLASDIAYTQATGMPLGVYMNITILAATLQYHEWLEDDFIQKYTELLPTKHQGNAENYALGECAFNRKSWIEAFEYAYQIPAANSDFKLTRGALLLRIAYEADIANASDLHDYEFQTVLQNFRSQLVYNKIKINPAIRAYTNFVNYTQRIYNLRNAKKIEQRAKKLYKNLSKEVLIAKKSWLLSKVEEFL